MGLKYAMRKSTLKTNKENKYIWIKETVISVFWPFFTESDKTHRENVVCFKYDYYIKVFYKPFIYQENCQ